MQPYAEEVLDQWDDDGTMPDSLAKLGEAVVGRKIVSVTGPTATGRWGDTEHIITLDNGMQVKLANTSDCCAFTELEAFMLNPELVNHMIMGVGTTDGYTKWHIYADAGDVLALTVNWSCGNPFYYGYGFDILVEPVTIQDEPISSEVIY